MCKLFYVDLFLPSVDTCTSQQDILNELIKVQMGDEGEEWKDRTGWIKAH